MAVQSPLTSEVWRLFGSGFYNQYQPPTLQPETSNSNPSIYRFLKPVTRSPPKKKKKVRVKTNVCQITSVLIIFDLPFLDVILLQFLHHHLHWFDWVFKSSRRLVMDSWNFLASGPAFKTLTSPHCEHGSIHQLFRPVHQAPGAARLCPRLRIFSSIMSRTGLSL